MPDDNATERLPIPEMGSDEAIGLMRVAFGAWEDSDVAEGARVGRYRLLNELGKGAFGVVWKAEQIEPIRRTVALKIVKAGMDTEAVVQRFNQERQTLALMDHPGIAAVFDAGATEGGRPFFVMEWVRGQPLVQYCDEHALTIRQRIELFVQVCAAVQHAHQKGILHRDLKPTNILVTEVDGGAAPKIIDFGIAKALLDHAGEDPRHQTQVGWVLGTPIYMSPEQAILGSTDLDTRADLYSLGVVLCELLSGRPPILDTESSKLPIDEMFRRIRMDTPRRPSALAAEGSTKEAADHGTTPHQWVSRLRGDLDWIVLKALEKNREQRYDSVASLAADLTRHLIHEPISAGKPSLLSSAWKFSQRHNTASIAAATTALALVVGTAVSTYAFIRENRIRTVAEAQRSRAEAEERRAETQLELSQKTIAFLDDLLEEIGAQVKQGRNPEALRFALDAVMARTQSFAGDATLRETILTHCTTIYRTLGEQETAIPLLREQLRLAEDQYGIASEKALAAIAGYSRALSLHGLHTEALAYSEEAVKRWRSLPVSERNFRKIFMAQRDHADLLRRAGRTDEALALFGQLERQTTPDIQAHSTWPTFIRCFAEVLLEKQHTNRAIKLLRTNIALLDLSDPEIQHKTALLYQILGRTLLAKRQVDEAIAAFEKSIDLEAGVYGDQSPHLSALWVEVSRLYDLTHRHDLAIECCRRAANIAQNVGDLRQKRASLRALAENLENAGDFSQAAATYLALHEAPADERLSESDASHSDLDLASAVRNFARAGLMDSLRPRLQELEDRTETELPSQWTSTSRLVRSVLCYAHCVLATAEDSTMSEEWQAHSLSLAQSSLKFMVDAPFTRSDYPAYQRVTPILKTAQARMKSAPNRAHPTPPDLLCLDLQLHARLDHMESSSPLLHVAAALRVLGHHDLALEIYEQIDKIDPDRHLDSERLITAHLHQVECLMRLDRFAEASRRLTQIQLAANTPQHPVPSPVLRRWLDKLSAQLPASLPDSQPTSQAVFGR